MKKKSLKLRQWWKITDSFDDNYQIAIKAKNKEGLESIVTLTFR